MTKYFISSKGIIPIEVEFEDQFKIVYRRNDICGKWTINKINDIDDLFPVFETEKEAYEYKLSIFEREIKSLKERIRQTEDDRLNFIAGITN